MADIPMKRAVIGSKTYEIVDEYARENIGENKDILMGLYPIETASGPIAVIHDGADSLPVRDLSVAIEPVQTGTGTPSPSNVRAITGWSAVKVARTSRNILDVYPRTGSASGVTYTNNADGSVTLNGTATSAGGASLQRLTTERNLKTGAYYARLFGNNLTGLTMQAYSNGASIFNRQSGSFIIPDDGTANFMRVRWDSGTVLDNVVVYPMLVEGTEEPTAYEYPQADTHTITLPTTVYGGTLDVTTGVLTVTKGLIASYAGETLPGAWISDRDVYAAGTTPTTGAQVVYPLATPITYTLTPTEIKTLLGENRIYADAGQVTVQYRADFNEAGLMYIPKAPTADGSYRLTADVTGGTPTYRWEAAE